MKQPPPNIEAQLADLRDKYIEHVAWLLARVRSLEAEVDILEHAARVRTDSEFLTTING